MSRLATLAVHAGREDLAGLGVHVPPIDLSTTNPVPSVASGGAAYEALATGGLPPAEGGLVYQRLWNPTVARFEDALASLEMAEQAVAFGSGMAALTACLIATVGEGKPHVVAVRPIYGGSDHLLATGLLGTEVTWVEPDGIAAALRPDTGLVLVETPANPTLELLDLNAVCEAAGDVPVIVDNTFATPVLQWPIEHGATLVLHSATKYLGGHGDVIGGVVATSADWAAKLRRVRAVTGGLMHPLAAYLLHRGLQTLPVRVNAQQATAVELAGWLGEQQHVERVYFPSGALVGRQMAGPGAMVAFSVAGGYDSAARLVEAVQLITHAVSLGGVDSLIQHPASLTHRPVEAHAKPDAAVVRMSVGLEHLEDLRDDLAYAIKEAHR
ncbi:methionine-gamma-lyase [Actinokineospora alba]|uniref:homocysteine desulfhydrase n=1 Tax=Actinokineospora alba TaxID=504798 RepID=A0A1H0UJS7_9PSEU|nr:PLP-dependent aspartate aminotransferase family protein [Actinokineospora alba]TDP65043.1 methionine-gamma-lyase [Actinokineospora alba]SDH52639.1 methionine-gamma-lyase [Actinokineospora alba]SDP66228.1 methionine-gamma-lyase [Actinokineospora alba]